MVVVLRFAKNLSSYYLKESRSASSGYSTTFTGLASSLISPVPSNEDGIWSKLSSSSFYSWMLPSSLFLNRPETNSGTFFVASIIFDANIYAGHTNPAEVACASSLSWVVPLL